MYCTRETNETLLALFGDSVVPRVPLQPAVSDRTPPPRAVTRFPRVAAVGGCAVSVCCVCCNACFRDVNLGHVFCAFSHLLGWTFVLQLLLYVHADAACPTVKRWGGTACCSFGHTCVPIFYTRPPLPFVCSFDYCLKSRTEFKFVANRYSSKVNTSIE